MRINKIHPILLFLIIGLLALSGNVSADEQADKLSPLPVKTTPRFFAMSRDFRLSMDSLTGLQDPPVPFSMIPGERLSDEVSTAEVRSEEEPRQASEITATDNLLFPSVDTERDKKPEAQQEDEQLDPILFFTNIEKMLTVDPVGEEDELAIADTDPVLISLEGDRELNEEVEPAKATEVDLTAVESAISVLAEPIPDIPVYSNKRIDAFIRMYTRKKRSIFEQAIERSGKYMKMIHRVFREYELPPNLAYLAVVESNFNPFARSRANAVGMWQFMKYTGRVFNLQNSWWHEDRYDPEKSTVAAAKYLKRLHKRFNGDWELALAAYNSGSGTVRRAIRNAKRQGKKTDFWSLKLPRETRGYVPAFYAVVTIFNNLDAYGFTQKPVYLDEVPKQTVTVAGGISLKQIAEALEVEHQVLSDMNLSLRLRGLIPPTFEKYPLNIPGEMTLTDQHFAKLEKLAEDRLSNWKTHTVRQGETLWSISRYYKIPVRKILAFNRFKRKNLINIGQKLMLPVANNWVAPVVPSRTKLAKKALDKLPGITYVHKVQKGDTLWKISNKYNIPIKVIKHWNRKVLNRRVLRIGTEIVLKLPVEKKQPALPDSV